MLLNRRRLLTGAFLTPAARYIVSPSAAYATSRSMGMSCELHVLTQLLLNGARWAKRVPAWPGDEYVIYLLPDPNTIFSYPPGYVYYGSTLEDEPFPNKGLLCRTELERVWEIAQGIVRGTPGCPIQMSYNGSFNVSFSLRIGSADLVAWAHRIVETLLFHNTDCQHLAASLPQSGGKVPV